MNTELIYTIVRYSILAIDILIIVCGLAYLGFGFLWGFRKNLRRMLSFIVPFLIFVCFINLIAKIFMNADISFILQQSDPISVKDFAIKLVGQYLYGGNQELANNSKIIELAEEIAMAGIRLVVYLIGIIVIGCIVAPIIRFCAWVTYRVYISKKDEKPRNNIISRVVGMGIGSIRYAVFTFLIIIPLFGFISTASMAIKDVIALSDMVEIDLDTEEQESSEVANQKFDLNVLEMVKKIDVAIDKSLMKRILKVTANKETGVTFDCYYLGEMIKVKTSDAQINIISEYGNIRRVFTVIPKIASFAYVNGEFSYDLKYKQLKDSDVDLVINAFQNIQSIDAVLPIGLEYGCYLLEAYDIDDKIGINIEDVKKIDINKDYKLLVESVGIVTKTFIKMDIDFNNITAVLQNQELPKTIEDFSKTIMKTDTINMVALPFATNYVRELIEKQNNPDFDKLLEILTTDNLKLCLENDISSLFDIAQDIYSNETLKGIIDEYIKNKSATEFQIDFKNEDIQKIISDSITKLMDLKVINGHENAFIETAFNLAMEKDFDINSILYTSDGISKINWDTEPEVLAAAIVKSLALFSDYIGKDNQDPQALLDLLLNDKEATKELVGKISESDIIRLIIVGIGPNFITSQEGIPQEIKDLLDETTVNQLNDKEVFMEQVDIIVDILEGLYNLGLTDYENFKLDPTKSEALKDVAKKALSSILIVGKEEKLFKLLVEKTNINSMLTEYGITLDYSKVSNWQNETSVMVDVIVGFMDIAGDGEFSFDQLFASDLPTEQIDKIANLFDTISKSELFKTVIYDMISKIGYDITLSETDKAKIEANTWGKEIKALLTLKGEAQSLLEAEDLSNVSGADVESLMLKASESVIATKIVGTILETFLGPDGLNINPVGVDGKPLYDFTDQQTMHDQAHNIGNLVNLANSVKNFNLDTLEGIEDVTTAISSLGSNDLAKEFVTEIVGEEVDLSGVDFEKEADVVQEVYEQYAAAPDKENFEVDPETAEKLENSGLAKAILSVLGLL